MPLPDSARKASSSVMSSPNAGGVIGQTIAMEGVFAFFAESVFLDIFLAGRERFGPRLHWLSSLFIFAGSWLSGFFIIATNAWMQHPVAYSLSDHKAQLTSLWGLLTNPWLGWIYAHNMAGAAITVRSCLLRWGRCICCSIGTTSSPGSAYGWASSAR